MKDTYLGQYSIPYSILNQSKKKRAKDGLPLWDLRGIPNAAGIWNRNRSGFAEPDIWNKLVRFFGAGFFFRVFFWLYQWSGLHGKWDIFTYWGHTGLGEILEAKNEKESFV